jgi:hypothetical protein
MNIKLYSTYKTRNNGIALIRHEDRSNNKPFLATVYFIPDAMGVLVSWHYNGARNIGSESDYDSDYDLVELIDDGDVEKRRCVKCLYANGDSIITSINGTVKSISEYFAIGKVFNIGNTEDNLQALIDLRFQLKQGDHCFWLSLK